MSGDQRGLKQSLQQRKGKRSPGPPEHLVGGGAEGGGGASCEPPRDIPQLVAFLLPGGLRLGLTFLFIGPAAPIACLFPCLLENRMLLHSPSRAPVPAASPHTALLMGFVLVNHGLTV